MFSSQHIASILVINPNSSRSVTDGLQQALEPITPPQTTLTFYTAPQGAPPSIDDITTGNLSATTCFQDMNENNLIKQHNGFLVCCFSDHPLIHMLRETTEKPVIGIMEAAIVMALLSGKRFGIISTGSGYKFERYSEVHKFIGGPSDRFAGLKCSGIGVVELREGDRGHVESKMREAGTKVAALGADVIILGCAGMAGMEALVRQGVAESSLPPVRVIDGAAAGIECLMGLIRLSR